MNSTNDTEDEPTTDGDISAETAPEGADVPTPPTESAQAAAPETIVAPNESSDGSAFMGVPIEVTISVGKARPLVSDLVKLRRDSVISLDTKIDDPVEVFIGDRLIARGELQEIEEMDGQLGVRLTEVVESATGT